MIEVVTEASLKKKLLWDLVPHEHVEELMGAARVVPGSTEGEDMEHRASHLRLALAAPVEQISVMLGALSGEILARCILEHQGMEQDDEVVAAYQHVAVTVSHAVLVNLLDLNLIHLGGHP